MMPEFGKIFICYGLRTRINTKLSRYHFHSKPIVTTPLPTNDQISHLISDQKSPTQALETFRWASKLPNFTHCQSTYKAVIKKLCAFREFDIVHELLDEMPSSIGCPPDTDIFVTLVRGLGRARRIMEVIKILELVSRFEKRPSLKIYNSILDVLVKEDIDIAREFYRKKMILSGMQGDDYTYGIMMKGLCRTNRIADAFKHLQSMKAQGLRPNTVVYNTLLHALCKNGNTGKARSLMKDIEEPNDVTFNILISAYCHDNNLVQALVILEKSLSTGFIPDKIAVTKLLDSLCKEGRISDAVQALERVEEKGGAFDVVAYNTLIKGFCRLGKAEAGSEFIKEMERKGCLPNADTYNSLISGYCVSGMFDSALDIFYEMNTVGVKLNFDTFNELIHGLSLGGKVEESLMILELMEENKAGSRPSINPYNSIIYGMYKANRLDEAQEFLLKMKTLFPKAVDRTQKILRHCEASNIDEAKDVYSQMTDSGIVPSAIIHTNMIHAFCQKERVQEAFDLMVDMIDRGYIPTAATVNTLITVYCGQNEVRNGVKLIEYMAGKKGFSPDSGTYNPVIVSLCSEGDLQTAIMLFMQMLEKGITPKYESWNALVVCLSQQTFWLDGNGELYLHKQFLRILGFRDLRLVVI